MIRNCKSKPQKAWAQSNSSLMRLRGNASLSSPKSSRQNSITQKSAVGLMPEILLLSQSRAFVGAAALSSKQSLSQPSSTWAQALWIMLVVKTSLRCLESRSSLQRQQASHWRELLRKPNLVILSQFRSTFRLARDRDLIWTNKNRTRSMCHWKYNWIAHLTSSCEKTMARKLLLQASTVSQNSQCHVILFFYLVSAVSLKKKSFLQRIKSSSRFRIVDHSKLDLWTENFLMVLTLEKSAQFKDRKRQSFRSLTWPWKNRRAKWPRTAN